MQLFILGTDLDLNCRKDERINLMHMKGQTVLVVKSVELLKKFNFTNEHIDEW